jgi:hypothetical protein
VRSSNTGDTNSRNTTSDPTFYQISQKTFPSTHQLLVKLALHATRPALYIHYATQLSPCRSCFPAYEPHPYTCRSVHSTYHRRHLQEPDLHAVYTAMPTHLFLVPAQCRFYYDESLTTVYPPHQDHAYRYVALHTDDYRGGRRHLQEPDLHAVYTAMPTHIFLVPAQCRFYYDESLTTVHTTHQDHAYRYVALHTDDYRGARLKGRTVKQRTAMAAHHTR